MLLLINKYSTIRYISIWYNTNNQRDSKTRLEKLILIRFPGISLYNNQTGLEVYTISNFKL